MDEGQREGGGGLFSGGGLSHAAVESQSPGKADVATLRPVALRDGEGHRGRPQELKIEVSGPLLAAPKIPSTQTKS